MYTVIDVVISSTCNHYYFICNSEQVSEVTEVIETMIDERNPEDEFFFDDIIDYVTGNFDCNCVNAEYICK